MSKPTSIEINGDKYRVMVLEVVESDGRGPRTFRRVHEDEKVKVKDQMSFWVVYARDASLDERPH